MAVVGVKKTVTLPHDSSKPPDSNNPFVRAQWRADRRSEAAASKPDIWIARKGVVIFVYGLVLWTGYVVIGRVAVPMLERRSNAGGGASAGAGIIVGYILLWLMFMWTYTMIVVVGPGFARDYVKQSEDPNLLVNAETASSTNTAVDPHGDPNPSELSAIPNTLPSIPQRAGQSTDHPLSTQLHSGESGKLPIDQIQRPQPQYHAGPRWCRFCKINKPDRTHHCRNCGTCILLYDHHCPWIGQCVGWGNHKEFIVFCGWASVLALYIILAGVITSVKTGVIDGQIIGSIAAAALFGLFTFSMFITHLTLVRNNTSTVESFAVKDQAERERYVLQREFGFCGGFAKKRAVRNRWNQEWGALRVDGRWRTGNDMREVMGEKWWMWILPIGRPKGDGMHFVQDERFGPNGEWLPKAQWPERAQAQ